VNTDSAAQMICLEDLIKSHKFWAFDCDGVVLDSNGIKTDAFHSCAVSYGSTAAEELVRYHKLNGGISRFKKFEYFLKTVVGKPFEQSEHDHLCELYGREVKTRLLSCPFTLGFLELFEKLRKSSRSIAIVSGGFESELNEVFAERNLANSFHRICGSPRSKVEILENLKDEGFEVNAGIFLGDAKADYDAANKFGMKFVFVKRYSESRGWYSSNTCFNSIEVDSLLQLQ